MDPSSSLLDSFNQAASTRSPSAQDVLVHVSTTIAPPEQVASQRTLNAPSELVAPQRTTSTPSEQAAPERAMSSPAGNDATDIVAIEVDGDDSSLSSASPLWDDLGRFYNLNCNLQHKFIPSFGLKGTRTKPRSSSSSSHATVPVERCAPGRLIPTRLSLPFNSREVDNDDQPLSPDDEPSRSNAHHVRSS